MIVGRSIVATAFAIAFIRFRATAEASEYSMCSKLQQVTDVWKPLKRASPRLSPAPLRRMRELPGSTVHCFRRLGNATFHSRLQKECICSNNSRPVASHLVVCGLGARFLAWTKVLRAGSWTRVELRSHPTRPQAPHPGRCYSSLCVQNTRVSPLCPHSYRPQAL